jgi:uncharacterized protein (TIGR03083 family)
MDDTEVWAAVDRRRSALVELLSGLHREEWDTPSLCEGWTVRDVAAHLTMVLLGKRQLVALALRYPGTTNRLIREGSKDLARRHDTDELVAMIGRMVGLHRPFPGLTCREALVDAVGHSLDMLVPLGRAVDIPPADVAEAADRVVAYGGRGKAKVFRSLPWQEFRLTADDHAWSTGDGPEVSGTMTDLFLLLTGRTVRLAELRGPGAERLRRTVAA